VEFEELEKIIHKALSSIDQNSENTVLLVFSGDSRYLNEKFFIEAKEIGRKKPLKIAIDKGAQRYITESQTREIQGLVKVYCCGSNIDIEDVLAGVDTVVLGSMDISSASKIARLIIDSLSEKVASESFIRGLRIMAASFIPEEIKNKNYYSEIKRLEGILESYGMEFLRVEDIKKQLIRDTNSSSNTGAQKVITESFIKDWNGKELKIEPDTVLTPLAKDAIHERKINLTRGK
jgi:hypothetical protein